MPKPYRSMLNAYFKTLRTPGHPVLFNLLGELAIGFCLLACVALYDWGTTGGASPELMCSVFAGVVCVLLAVAETSARVWLRFRQSTGKADASVPPATA
jgi:hypothetical protein